MTINKIFQSVPFYHLAEPKSGGERALMATAGAGAILSVGIPVVLGGATAGASAPVVLTFGLGFMTFTEGVGNTTLYDDLVRNFRRPFLKFGDYLGAWRLW